MYIRHLATNSQTDVQLCILLNGKYVNTVRNFTYLGSTASDINLLDSEIESKHVIRVGDERYPKTLFLAVLKRGKGR